MASRKPSISRVSKPKKQTAAESANLASAIVAGIQDAMAPYSNRVERLEYAEARFANAINSLTSRVAALESTIDSLNRAPPQPTEVSFDVQVVLDRIADIGGKLDRLLEAKPAARKPREPKEGVAIKGNDVVDQGAPVAEEKPAPAAESKPKPEYKDPRPCKGCGVNLDEPGVKHSGACTEQKPSPKADAPTFEVLREKAVAFAQKHSKAKMLEVLAPFAGVPAAEVKLSIIAEEKRAAAIAALEAA